MDESATARGAAPSAPRRVVSCPPWCTDCRHDDIDPPGTALHRSPPATVPVYNEAGALIAVHVRAAFWDKAPDFIGTDPADLEHPHVEVTEPDGAGVPLYLTPAQARSFAAALVRAADAATEASHRAPVVSGGSSLPAPARVPPLSA